VSVVLFAAFLTLSLFLLFTFFLVYQAKFLHLQAYTDAIVGSNMFLSFLLFLQRNIQSGGRGVFSSFEQSNNTQI